MSLLILAVGWAYTQICRIYPDGGGVYTAAKSRSKTLAVVGAKGETLGALTLARIRSHTRTFDAALIDTSPADP